MGCGGDNAETALVAQNLSDEEVLTKKELYKTADWEIRWEKSRAARKRYMKLRGTYPDAALSAYIEYCNWMEFGHPLATEAATLAVKMDLAGQTNIPEVLQKYNLELQIAKDNAVVQDWIDEIEEKILFWSELSEELEAEGHDPAEFIIQFKIGEEADLE